MKSWKPCTEGTPPKALAWVRQHQALLEPEVALQGGGWHGTGVHNLACRQHHPPPQAGRQTGAGGQPYVSVTTTASIPFASTSHRRGLLQVEKSEDTHEPRDHIVISEFFDTFRYRIEVSNGQLQHSRDPDDNVAGEIAIEARNPRLKKRAHVSRSVRALEPLTAPTLPGIVDQLRRMAPRAGRL